MLYIARYANCFRGNSEVNVHAEEFLLSDNQLLDTVGDLTERQARRLSGHREALANPEALDLYRDLEELKS